MRRSGYQCLKPHLKYLQSCKGKLRKSAQQSGGEIIHTKIPDIFQHFKSTALSCPRHPGYDYKPHT